MSDIIKNYMISGINENLYTSCVLEIRKDNKLFFRDCSGVLDPREPKNKTKVDSLFDLASLTKIFISVLFMKLVEEGKVKLSDKVQDIEPKFIGKNKNLITFEHILSHSSGLPDSFNLYENHEWNKGNSIVFNKLFNTELVYQPGEKIIYSCLGFMFLGYLIEKITDKRLDEVLYEKIFKPLNLNNIMYKPDKTICNNIAITTFERPNRGSLNPGTVHDGNAIAIHDGISGNAGLFASADEVANLGQMFLNKTFLKKETIDLMLQTHAEYEDKKRGLGWQLHSSDETSITYLFSEKSFGHTGYCGTSLVVDPKKELVISFLTNSVHFYKNSGDLNKFKEFRNVLYKKILDTID